MKEEEIATEVAYEEDEEEKMQTNRNKEIERNCREKPVIQSMDVFYNNITELFI